MSKQFNNLQVGDSIYDVYWYDSEPSPRITESLITDVTANILTYLAIFPNGDKHKVSSFLKEETKHETKIYKGENFGIGACMEAAMWLKYDMISKKNKKQRKR